MIGMKMMIKEFNVSTGCKLLSRWQAKDDAALGRLREIFDAAIAGEFDAEFSRPTEENAVNIGGSLNLMTLTIMNDLYGYQSAEFYKGDAVRYVRTTLLSRRLLGMNKLYVSWPVYGFTAEALGQTMMYPDRFPPGPDPEVLLLKRVTWKAFQNPVFKSGFLKFVTDIKTEYENLTGFEPTFHLRPAYRFCPLTHFHTPGT